MTITSPTPPADAEIERLADFVRRHRGLMVLTGAGVSTDSGIPDYRDGEGAWKRPPPMTFQAFMGGHAARQRYWSRSMIGWRLMGQASPGPAHRAIARLQQHDWFGSLVTQNVDGLHEAAGGHAGVDLHGRIDTVRCMGCEQRTPRAHLQVRLQQANPAWIDLAAEAAPDGDAHLEGPHEDFVVPACEACGGLLKPDVVFFGEAVPRERVQTVFERLAASPAMLVVGSSLMVWSGLRFVHQAVADRRPVAAVNLGRTRADDLLTLKLAQPAGPALVALAQALSVASG